MGSKILAGRYEIIEKIGDGGMAVVYKAKDRLLSRFVAVKILRPEHIKDTVFMENFRRESKAAASLLHPNIVTIYDVGKDGDVNYIVMEYIEGCTLSDLIAKESPMDYKKCINIAKQIASALSLAHRNNIIHRDVKPHNILITKEGIAKITDFGIAKAVSDGTIISESGMIMGSVHYFSPEQSRGQYVDEKSDIYSLGIVIYEMLTGRVPFDADNPVTIAVMHMNDTIIPPSKMVKGVPPGLDQIVLKATAKFQSDRFKTMDEMFKALDNVNFITGIIDDPEIAGYVAPVIPKTEDNTAAQNTPSYDNDYYDDDEDYYDDDDGYYDDEYEEKEKNSYRDKYDDDDDYYYDEERPRNKKGSKNKRKKRMPRKFVVLAIVSAIIAALILSYFLTTGISSILSDKYIAVPDVVGMTEVEAIETLEKEGFKVDSSVAETTPMDAVDSSGEPIVEGEVLTQTPKAGRKAQKGSTIDIKIAGSPDAFTGEVPDLSGMTEAEAEHAIVAAGFAKGKITREESDQEPDRVVKQDPEAGATADRDTKINITISKGIAVKTSIVPELVGLKKDEAVSILSDVGLDVGDIGEDFSSEYKEGLVIWQEFEPGSELTEGNTVSIKVSKGKEATEEPTTLTVTIDLTKASTDSFTLTVQFVDASGTPQNLLNEEETQKSQGSTILEVTGVGSGTINAYFNGSLSQSFSIDFTTGQVISI